MHSTRGAALVSSTVGVDLVVHLLEFISTYLTIWRCQSTMHEHRFSERFQSRRNSHGRYQGWLAEETGYNAWLRDQVTAGYVT